MAMAAAAGGGCDCCQTWWAIEERAVESGSGVGLEARERSRAGEDAIE